MHCLVAWVLAVVVVAQVAARDGVASARERDWRNIETGQEIPDESYCDQPYIVITQEGSWLCVMTTGKGHEGGGGQHVVATTSRDQGKSWGPLVDIEPADGPEASWVVPLIVPSGRVYAFYTYNGDRIRSLPGSSRKIRADMLGWYCYRYSDDHGRTWSERHRIPLRTTACDRANQWQGKVQVFWGIDKPKVGDRGVTLFITKLGKYMLANGEGWMVHSDNILTELDPEKIHWQLLPDGEHGVRNPTFGSVQEEHNHVSIGDDKLYVVYRTTRGYPCHSYSSDGGKSWDTPTPMTYSPGGRTVKTPRACPKLWRCKNGKYLFWFHNHGGRGFRDRNPAWLIGGVVRDGAMHWSEPEILLYGKDRSYRSGRMSYPDLIEEDGNYWISETQKTTARIHAIPAELLEGMWQQHDGVAKVAGGAVLSLRGDQLAAGRTVDLPALPDLALGGGFSVDVWLQADDIAAGQTILDSRDDAGRGVALTTGDEGTVVLTMNDGVRNATWASDSGVLTAGKRHHVVFIVDGGPCIISAVCDGALNDGGPGRQCGWGRFDQKFGRPSGDSALRLAPDLKGTVSSLRIYDRQLRTAEAVSSFRAGAQATR